MTRPKGNEEGGRESSCCWLGMRKPLGGDDLLTRGSPVARNEDMFAAPTGDPAIVRPRERSCVVVAE